MIEWRYSSCSPEGQLIEKGERGSKKEGNERMRKKRVVFADLILTTSPGRAFSWNHFAIALLFIQVVGESSKICREHAFCNTSL